MSWRIQGFEDSVSAARMLGEKGGRYKGSHELEWSRSFSLLVRSQLLDAIYAATLAGDLQRISVPAF